MGIRHHFQSARADNTDAGEVQPSHWNADHDLTGVLAELDALGVGANLLFYLDDTASAATAALSPLARSLLAAASAVAMRTVLAAASIVSTTVQTIAATGELSIDRSLGEAIKMSLTGNVTSFSVANWPAAGQLGRIVLEIRNTGAFNIAAWPAGTTWAGGAPTITSGAGAVDLIVLTTFDGGTTIRGAVVGQNFA